MAVGFVLIVVSGMVTAVVHLPIQQPGPRGGMGINLSMVGNRIVSPIQAPVPVARNENAIPGADLYGLNFTETGLPPGTGWYVNCSGPGLNLYSVNRTILVGIWNGSLFCTIQAANRHYAAAAVSFTMNGTPLLVPVQFSPAYTVTFAEMGLPKGTPWGVFLEGITATSNTSTIAFPEANATMWFFIDAMYGYTTVPNTEASAGHVTVNGNNPVVSVVFTSITYSVRFTESGLPDGTNWSMTVGLSFGPSPWTVVNGTTEHSSTTTISFTEAEIDGPTFFSVVSVSGYTSSPSGGMVADTGTNQSVTINFTASPASAGFLGLPGYTGYLALGGIGIAVVVAAAFALTMRTRRR